MRVRRIRITVIKAPSKTIFLDSISIFCHISEKWKTDLDKAISTLRNSGFYGSIEEKPPERKIEEKIEKSYKKSDKKLKTVHDADLPSWVLCSIANSVMRFPIQLPSGHWVDKTTVEKWRSANLCLSKGMEFFEKSLIFVGSLFEKLTVTTKIKM